MTALHHRIADLVTEALPRWLKFLMIGLTVCCYCPKRRYWFHQPITKIGNPLAPVSHGMCDKCRREMFTRYGFEE